MAHQGHALPWGSLASNFKYHKLRHIPTHSAEIHPEYKPNHFKQIEHFSKVFAKQVKEFAATERAKYRPGSEYKKRSETWIISTKESESPSPPSPISDTVAEAAVGEQPVKRHQLKIANDWKTGKETRQVFTDALSEKYRKLYFTLNVKLEPQLQNIEGWFQPVTGNFGYYTGGPESMNMDVMKILMMEAAEVTLPLPLRHQNPSLQRQHVETILLIAHHPKITINYWRWAHDSNGCCSTTFGVANSFVRKALRTYLYLNILYTLREKGSDVCAQTTSMLRSEDSGSYYANRLRRKNARLGPTRGKYMNTTSWVRLAEDLTLHHENHPEVVMYEPFLQPSISIPPPSSEVEVDKKEEGKYQVYEHDPLEDSAWLREYLRGLWKVLIIFEMFWTEAGQTLNWEEFVSEQLSDRDSYRSGIFDMPMIRKKEFSWKTGWWAREVEGKE